MTSNCKNDIYKLRLKYGLYAALAGLIFCGIATVYAMLDAKYHLSKALVFKIEENILGNHKFIFPSLTRTVFSSCLIFLTVVGGWIASYQIYHKYKYKVEYFDQLYLHKKDSSKYQKPEEKRISKKNLLIGCAIILGHNLLSFMNDELSIAFQKAISEKVDLFFWLAYSVILLIVFITSSLDVVQTVAIADRLALVLKDAVKKENNKKLSLKERLQKMNWKEIGSKYGVFALISLMIVFSSFGFAAFSKHCDWINFDLPPIIIGENKINWFTNQQNTFFLILMPILLFVLAYKYVLPVLEKKFKTQEKKEEENAVTSNDQEKKNSLINQEKKSTRDHCVDLLQSIGLSILSAVSIDISINVSNSLQELKVENGAYAICLVILFIVNIISAYCFVKQYIDPPALSEEKDNIKLNKEKGNIKPKIEYILSKPLNNNELAIV